MSTGWLRKGSGSPKATTRPGAGHHARRSLTGYYPQQVNRDPPGQRPKWAALLPELLKSAGYRSYHSGKWHVDGPVLQGGFSRSYHLDDTDRYFSPKKHNLDDRPLAQPKPDDGYYATRAIAGHAVDWLVEHESKHRGEPFFLYLAFTSPHFPSRPSRRTSLATAIVTRKAGIESATSAGSGSGSSGS